MYVCVRVRVRVRVCVCMCVFNLHSTHLGKIFFMKPGIKLANYDFLIKSLKNSDETLHKGFMGTISRTGITSNKIHCYMRDSACRWYIVKKAKTF